MSMLLIRGRVENVFSKAESKDRETGEVRPASVSVQVLGYNVTPEGENKLDLQTLKCQSPAAAEAFRKLKGQEVLIPVGYFLKDGQLLMYSLKAEAMPIPLKSSGAAAA